MCPNLEWSNLEFTPGREGDSSLGYTCASTLKYFWLVKLLEKAEHV